MLSSIYARNKQHLPWLEWFLLVLFVTGYYTWLSANALHSGSENSRLLEVFDGDEYQNFNVVHDALVNHTLSVNWEIYGHFYFNLALLPFSVLQKFTPITDTMLIYFQRLQSTVFAAATVLVTFGLARRYFSRLAAWTGSMLLMVVPYEFNYWSVTSHPDTLQMFLLMVGLFFCCEYALSRKEKWLLVAAAFAGLAFATKYAGVFLLPVIWILCLGVYDKLAIPFALDFLSYQKAKSSFRLVSYTVVVFLAAFVIASPYSLVDLQFIKGIRITSSFTSTGATFLINNNRFEWFEILGSDSLMGMIYGTLLLFALLSFFVKAWNTRGAEVISYKGLLWVWVLFFFFYAFFRVNLHEVRYMLIILPALYILLGVFFTEILDYVRGRFQEKTIRSLAMVIILAACAAGIWSGFARQAELIKIRQTREINNPAIQAGEWLEQNYGPSTRILYDAYSYVPPKFKKIYGSYGMDQIMLVDKYPKIVVINPGIRDRFVDPAKASYFIEGAGKYMAKHDFYVQMEKEMLGFHLVYELGGIKIFEREKDK